MPSPDSLVGLENLPSHVVITIHPELAKKPWVEIEAVGAQVISRLEARDGPTCLIDLTTLTYMGSGMVAFIVRLWKVIKSKNGRMAVVCNNQFVLEVLELAALDKLWAIVPDHESAYRHLRIRGVQLPASVSASPQREAAGPRTGTALVVVAVLGLAVAVGTLLAADQITATQRVLRGVIFGTGGLAVVCGIAALLRGGGWRRPVSAVIVLCSILLLVAAALSPEVSLVAFKKLLRATPPGPEAVRVQKDTPSAAEQAAASLTAEGDGGPELKPPESAGPEIPPAAGSAGDQKKSASGPPPTPEGTSL